MGFPKKLGFKQLAAPGVLEGRVLTGEAVTLSWALMDNITITDGTESLSMEP